MIKASYDVTLCGQLNCPMHKNCYRHISHYLGEHLVFQSMSVFNPDEDSCTHFLDAKPWGTRWEEKDV